MFLWKSDQFFNKRPSYSIPLTNRVSVPALKMIILYPILVVLLTIILWHRRQYYKLSWQLAGPIGLPILGNALSIINPRNVLSFLDDISLKYESPMRLWFGPQMVVFVSDAENVEIVLKSKDCLNKPYDFYKILRDALSVDGFFTLKAETWKIHRRLVSPTINSSSVSAHLPVFNQNIQRTIDKMPVNGEFFDILDYLTECKITMFTEAALGLEWEPHIKQTYLRNFTDGVRIVAKRVLQPLYHIDFIWNRTNYAARLRKYNTYGRELFAKILNEASESNSEGHSFLERLLDVSKKNANFTSEDVLAETATILTGATDTSSAASAFVAVMLALHPEYQEKVFHEIMQVMPDKKADLTQADLDKLEFTDLCIRETLRLFPTAPLIAREPTKPVKLSNGIVVPPNTPIIFGIRQIHIQEKYFGPTAKVFDPYRFSEENVKTIPSAAYIPFSYGPRNCIGYFYAKVSVKCFVVHLIRNYRLTTIYKHIDELQIVLNTSMRITNKHMVKLEHRN